MDERDEALKRDRERQRKREELRQKREEQVKKQKKIAAGVSILALVLLIAGIFAGVGYNVKILRQIKPGKKQDRRSWQKKRNKKRTP